MSDVTKFLDYDGLSHFKDKMTELMPITGTTAEIQAMIDAGTLKSGQVVIVTDDGTAISGDASDIEYDNTTSELTATNVQDAIDEVKASIDEKQDKLTNPLTQSDVVNNLTSDNETVPLSAAMGKSLNTTIDATNIPVALSANQKVGEAISSLNTNITSQATVIDQSNIPVSLSSSQKVGEAISTLNVDLAHKSINTWTKIASSMMSENSASTVYISNLQNVEVICIGMEYAEVGFFYDFQTMPMVAFRTLRVFSYVGADTSKWGYIRYIDDTHVEVETHGISFHIWTK